MIDCCSTGQRQVRQKVAVQIKLMRQTEPGNSLVRDNPGDGLIDDPRRSCVGRSTVVRAEPSIHSRLQADSVRVANRCTGINRIRSGAAWQNDQAATWCSRLPDAGDCRDDSIQAE